MSKKPRIQITSQDMSRLEALLESYSAHDLPGKEMLQAELDRADEVEPGAIPPTVVTMNSTIRFAFENSEEAFCMTLVYPGDIDGSAEQISVLAPAGSALLGLSVGDTLEWPGPDGDVLNIRVEEIVHQPESARAKDTGKNA